jgi:tight adherence protein B
VALRTALVELLGALGGELVSGAEPRAALVAAAGDHPLLVEVVASARSPGPDVAAALRDVGARPGGSLAADLALVWEVADRSGASLAAPVSRLFLAAREDERVRRELAAQLAGPRATARLLAALPLLGLAIGASLGAQPVQFLLGTAPGRGCLIAGVALLAAGLRWSRAIHRQAAAWIG